MAGMFPTMVTDSNDPNRNHRSSAWTAGQGCPRNLRVAFYLICTAGVLMLLTAFTLLANGYPGDDVIHDVSKLLGDVADEEFRQRYMTNMRVTAWGSIILTLWLVSAAAYFPKGSSTARRWAGVGVALTCFLHLASFVVQLTAWVSMVVVVLLVVAMLLAFRPDSNAYVDEMSPRFQ